MAEASGLAQEPLRGARQAGAGMPAALKAAYRPKSAHCNCPGPAWPEPWYYMHVALYNPRGGKKPQAPPSLLLGPKAGAPGWFWDARPGPGSALH